MIIPINYPAKPEVANPHSALQYSTQQLKHWDMAPDNLKKLSEKNIKYSLTSSGLKNKKDFRKNLSKSIRRGLNEADALASLTTVPAKAFGQSKRLGKIAPDYIANLVITNGNYFHEDSKVQSVWIEGSELQLSPDPINNYAGLWTFKERERTWALDIDKDGLIFSAKLIKDSISISVQNLSIVRDQISFTINDTAHFNNGAVRFFGRIEKKEMSGKIIYADNNRSSWTAQLDSKKPSPVFTMKKEEPSKLEVFSPEGAYGVDEKIIKPKTILVDDATIWTSGPDGVLEGFDILFQNGRVKQIAKNIYLNDKNAIIIDGKGKHITPGLIDAHSHMAGESINEGFQNVTAEVRMRDVIDPNDIAMYRALAGGLTTINLLHGSANPIGGQSVVMKLRWGSFSNDLIFNEASQAIKFALGENVKRKRSYGRYPETRMGVEQVIRDAFSAARDYNKLWNTYNKDAKLQRTKLPPRRDLELDALVEILNGKRIVHAHSYRQDEILMLTRIAEDFGFTMGTFQHVLEGYKVAERLVEHGASASTFSDWWAYKFEVIDAIPFNGTLMANVGVNVSFNSDSDELARRMNLEAAKAVKYGGLSEEEALKMVTINPAKQLKIDKYVGSLEIGKDADFVLWSGHPLSNYSICEETWVDGKQYFSQSKDRYFRERDEKLRNDLIQKILVSSESGSSIIIPNSEDANKYHTCNNDNDHNHNHEGAH
jgi:imidazolonepropionase-like amidohydrolase